jgi:type IV pilus assembly protein PilW
MKATRRSNLARQRGRTLLELLISMAVGLVILGALIAIYLSTHASARQAAAVSRLNEDASVVLNLLGTQLRMAGFSPPRVHMVPGAAMVDGVLVSVPDRNFIGAGIRGCDHGFANHTTDEFEDLVCADEPSGAAAFAVRFEGQHPDDIASVALLPPNTDCLNQGIDTDTIGALGAPYRLVESRFLVRVGPASGTPELACAGKGAKSFAAYPLMQFVEDMSIAYGVADDGVGRQVKNYLDARQIDDSGGTVDQRWSRVVTVDLCILMRSADPDPAGAGSYVDCKGKSKLSTDGLIRRAYRSVFALRNRSGFSLGAS